MPYGYIQNGGAVGGQFVNVADPTQMEYRLGQGDQARGQQEQGVNMALQAAQGKTPSAADIQMRSGIGQAQQAAASQAASTRGNFGMAGAAQNAAATQAGLSQQAVNQGAALRAQEQNAGLAAYLGATGQVRQGDIQGAGLESQFALGQSGQMAGMGQQIQQQGWQGGQNTTGALMGMGSAAIGALAMFSDENAKRDAFTAGMQAVTGGFKNGAQIGRKLASKYGDQPAGGALTAGPSTTEASPQNQYGWSGAHTSAVGGDTTQNPYPAGGLGVYTDENPMGLDWGSTLGDPSGQFATGMGSGEAAEGLAMTSDHAAKKEAHDLGFARGFAMATKPEALAQTARMPPAVTVGGDVAVLSPEGYMFTGHGAEPKATGDVAVGTTEGGGAYRGPLPSREQPTVLEDVYRGVREQTKPEDTRMTAMEATSDERAKRAEVQHTGVGAARQFLDTLEPHAFTWKDPSVAPNPKAAASENLGVYAQQVEKSPWGAAIVQDDPRTGLKQLDIKALVGALAAGAGAEKKISDDHARRLEALERFVTGGR